MEAVPNFSEGRDAGVIARLRGAVADAPGMSMLDCSSDADHNRTVITLAGETEAVSAGALRLMEVAVQAIDLTRHAGVHPRLGALDVLPFVPLGAMTLQQCAQFAVGVGEEIWRLFRVPVYLYEEAAWKPAHRALENLRRPGFAGPPDIGVGRHPTAGAVVVGARRFLVAWNIWLDSEDLELARRIAREIRFSSGGFPGVKALGLPLASRGRVQVSMNSTDFEATPLHVVFGAVVALAERAGVRVTGSELIGLIPARVLELSAGYDLRWMNLRGDSVLEARLDAIATR